jgi:2-amino-4-hydroxy-6-hydroxymethyldihydropteridine diphosphokinase
MPFPIRITFHENAEHLMEALKETPVRTKPLISNKAQNLFIGFLVTGAIGYELATEYRKGENPKILAVAGVATVLALLFWLWFFKKIGLGGKAENLPYKWTEKDLARLQKRYRRRTGKDETLVEVEFDETGFRLHSEDQVQTSEKWESVKRVIETSRGLLVVVFRKMECSFWFPKNVFASQSDYSELVKLIKTKVREFQKLDKRCFIALGSNLGDSAKAILSVVAQLESFSAVPLLKSSLWQSSPVDCPPGSPPFVNAAVALTPLEGETPETLLKKLQQLEKEFGRQPKKILNEPRPLDLDLIAFGNETRASEKLTLPHPRAHERRFVLQPLSEIAPDIILPGQKKTVRQLLDSLQAYEVLTRLDNAVT